jgi:hypothetical protein
VVKMAKKKIVMKYSLFGKKSKSTMMLKILFSFAIKDLGLQKYLCTPTIQVSLILLCLMDGNNGKQVNFLVKMD